MDIRWEGNTREKRQLEFLLGKCRNEARHDKLYNHLEAVKSYLLVYLIQQNTITYQIRNSQVVEGGVEDHLVENCTRCVGECKEAMRELHKLLRKYEKGGTDSTDSMDFRVKSTRIIVRLEQNLDRFNQLINSGA
ncbi:MAG: hypothetical protein HQL69_24560 [Magnetococcales bacterium]|nr:hypothetical protein [Magnetococcales bacterium]